MEPFAINSQPRRRAPWIAAGVICFGFSVWQLNLLPRLGHVETGNLAAPESGDSAEHHEGFETFDRIVDRSADPVSPDVEDDVDDPLRVALASVSEPIQVPAPSSSAGRHRVTSDHRSGSAVQPASFEMTADEDDVGREPATVIPAELAERLREIDQMFRDDFILEAHAELSQIYWKEPSLLSLIRARIEHTASLIYASGDRLFDAPLVVEPGDTLSDIAARHQVTWQYLAKLNRTAPDRLQAGQQLKVLKGPFSVVVDLSDFAMTVHCHGWYVHRYRIGIGQDDATPPGEFTVQEKLENPTWYNPDGGQVDADDPSNPLGEYWIGLGNHIGIHGTIDPDSIGKAKSRGCIHLADPDISEVYHLLTVGSQVLIRK